jgi:hypothetical protein
MSAQNTVHIINYFPHEAVVFVSDSDWNCCDTPTRGEAVGTIPAGRQKDLNYRRTDGHGCNGRQGEFALSINVGGRDYVQQFDCDSDGNLRALGQAPGLEIFVKQVSGGNYACAFGPAP